MGLHRGNYSSYQKSMGLMGDGGYGSCITTSITSEYSKKAREINPGFVFWEENFTLSIESKKKGFNAVLDICLLMRINEKNEIVS